MDEFLRKVDQTHLVKFCGQMNDGQIISLENDIKKVDWQKVEQILKDFSDESANFVPKPKQHFDENLLQPLSKDVLETKSELDIATINKYQSLGLSNAKQRNMAALVLAGGQGTRLGFNYPKGMLDVGLASKKTLFQLQADRILSLSRKAGLSDHENLYWYIMTSPSTHSKTVEFFEANNNFGLAKETVVFFEQSTLPAFDIQGKILLDDKDKISNSPDGNGSLFEALHRNEIITDMRRKSIQFVHVYCVDNILVRVCDPVFMGFCIYKKAEAASKVVEKHSPDEAVGTICLLDNKVKIVEYSEIPETIAKKRDETTGKLLYSAGNICEQFFTVDFLAKVGTSDKPLPYHVAFKKIPHIDLENGCHVKPSKPNGVKFERFIFDVLEYTDKFYAWQVSREDEFAPIKNPNAIPKDNPNTAKTALLRVHAEGKLEC